MGGAPQDGIPKSDNNFTVAAFFKTIIGRIIGLATDICNGDTIVGADTVTSRITRAAGLRGQDHATVPKSVIHPD